MCTVLLPPGANPTAVNKYIIYILCQRICRQLAAKWRFHSCLLGCTAVWHSRQQLKFKRDLLPPSWRGKKLVQNIRSYPVDYRVISQKTVTLFSRLQQHTPKHSNINQHTTASHLHPPKKWFYGHGSKNLKMYVTSLRRLFPHCTSDYGFIHKKD
jgi:hypothetical protein